MKKILALLVAIMMMAIPAMADMVIVQDGKAPEVLTEGVTLTGLADRAEGSALAAAFAASLNQTKVVTEMFHVEVAAPTTVTVVADAQSAAYTADGQTWEALAVTVDGEKVSFDVQASGTVALLVDFVAGMFDGISVTELKAITTDIAQQFTPSVAAKAAPALKEVVSLIKGEEKIPVTPTYLIITPLALSAYSSDVVTHELLQWAYQNIMAGGPAAAEAEINAVLADTGVSYADMLVHDLFETSLYGEKGEELAVEGVQITFELNAGFEKGETVVVIYSADAQNWNVLPADNYSVLDDGSIELTMDTLGAIAFMIAQPEATVTSPAN